MTNPDLKAALVLFIDDSIAEGDDYSVVELDTHERTITLRWDDADCDSVYAYTLDSDGNVTDVEFLYYGDPDEVEPDESMDGDFDSGMASAGLGTDEDYGCYGGDDW